MHPMYTNHIRNGNEDYISFWIKVNDIFQNINTLLCSKRHIMTHINKYLSKLYLITHLISSPHTPHRQSGEGYWVRAKS
jgi:hypothetical protein